MPLNEKSWNRVWVKLVLLKERIKGGTRPLKNCFIFIKKELHEEIILWLNNIPNWYWIFWVIPHYIVFTKCPKALLSRMNAWDVIMQWKNLGWNTVCDTLGRGRKILTMWLAKPSGLENTSKHDHALCGARNVTDACLQSWGSTWPSLNRKSTLPRTRLERSKVMRQG